MNLVQIFTRNEAIAGLEISEDALRIVLFGKNKDGSLSLLAMYEQVLSKGIVEAGEVRNAGELIKALRLLLRRPKTYIRYVIASIPHESVYVKVIKFPVTLDHGRLREAVDLAVLSQLPRDPKGSYVDWHVLDGGEVHDVVISMMPQEIAKTYLDCLQHAGLKPVALETHPMSAGRAIERGEKVQTLLVTQDTRASFLAYVVKDGFLRFSRILPSAMVPVKKRNEEVKKIKHFYEVEDVPIEDTYDINDIPLASQYDGLLPKKQQHGKWGIVVGAAIRGVLPRNEDNLTSLMATGTEEAYAIHRAETFTEFIASVTIGLSVFFSVVFLGMWLFLVSLQQSTLSQIEALSAVPAPANASELEHKANEINTLLTAESAIIKTLPRWSRVLEALQAISVPGIKVVSLSLPSAESVMTITGVANDRVQLNAYRRSFEKSSIFSDINSPLTNLDQKEKIPFTITFKLRDPRSIYVQP